ncbi:MAG: hypothetical protein QG610_2306 [Euryarchaeota archaeon]|nr:hypothetical protein [Euryarchaeota archaeon]
MPSSEKLERCENEDEEDVPILQNAARLQDEEVTEEENVAEDDKVADHPSDYYIYHEMQQDGSTYE